MTLFTVEEITRATGGSAQGDGTVAVTGVSTDSRSVGPGELFVPLRGERFDGHDFIASAVGRGVTAVLAERGWLARHQLPEKIACVAVDDTLRALGDLAAWHRNRFRLPVVGITGSNGKTTTKEMLGAILARGGNGLKTAGNLNNLIGLPQMLLRLSSSDRWAVLEMGMSEAGEIDRLAEIARPRVGVITNVFPAHLESMGSVAAVARAKGELFGRLAEGGTAVANADDPLVAALPVPAGVARLTFGLAAGEVTATDLVSLGIAGQSFTLRLPGGAYPVRLAAFGRHNVQNALAAAAAAVALGIDGEEIRGGLESFTPYDKRFRLEEIHGVVLIDDSYNANPASTAAALATLRDLKGGHRAIAVLGDMLELGEERDAAHREIGRLAAACVDRLYLLGGMAGLTAAAAREAGLSAAAVRVAATHDEIVADLSAALSPGDFILVKGSRGMRMEVVAEAVRRGSCGEGGA